MLRYFQHVLIITGTLILLSGCKGGADVVDQVTSVGQNEDAHPEDSQGRDAVEERAPNHTPTPPDEPKVAGDDKARSTRPRTAAGRQSRGPRKIPRPAATTRQDPDEDAPETEEKPPRSAPVADTPTSAPRNDRPTNAREQDDGENHAADGNTDNEEESARHFSFDGSDEELDMILGVREIPPFRIDDLLTVADLRDGLGPHTPTTIGQLQGQAATPFYNNLWFKSQHEGHLGVVLQYWHFQTPKAAQTHYEMLEKTAMSEPKPVGIGSEAYYIDLDGSLTLVALQVGNNAVTSLTCDIQNCYVPQLMRWTTLIHERAVQPTSP